ncbi:MAG: CAP domain-containing protein [Xenococcaceae cyanobacterium]
MRQIKFFAIAFTSALITGVANAALLPQHKNIVENYKIPRELYQVERIFIAQSDSSKTDQSALEESILEEMNRARTNPAVYADWLEEMRQYYDDNLLKLPGESEIKTKEGIEAVNEAIRFLRNLSPLPALSLCKGLTMAARDYLKDRGATSEAGHSDNDSSQIAERICRYGSVKSSLGGNISYSQNTAQGVVMQLIIDDGVPDRRNRKNIFNPDFKMTGFACGPHASHENMCVITYAGEYKETIVEEPDSDNTVNSSQPSTNIESSASSGPSEITAAPLLLEQGVLEEGDSVIPNDGSLYDSYTLQGRACQSLTIAVESQDFDTYLAIQDPRGIIIAQHDDIDINKKNTNSTLTITLPSDGVYNLIVNAYDPKGRGQYTLTVRQEYIQPQADGTDPPQ